MGWGSISGWTNYARIYLDAWQLAVADFDSVFLPRYSSTAPIFSEVNSPL